MAQVTNRLHRQLQLQQIIIIQLKKYTDLHRRLRRHHQVVVNLAVILSIAIVNKYLQLEIFFSSLNLIYKQKKKNH